MKTRILPEQTQYYRDLYERTTGKKLPEDFDERKKEYGGIRKDLKKFIEAKALEIGKILSKARSGKTAHSDFSNALFSVLAGERERLGVPKFVPLEALMAFVEYRHTHRLDLPYDAFVRMIPSKALKKAEDVKPPRIDTIVANQGSYAAQALVELIANGIDASVPEKSIGRFGEGFFQTFQFLKTERDRLVVRTKTEGNAGINVEFRKRRGRIEVSMREDLSRSANGTSVRFECGSSESASADLKTENTVEFLKSKFATGIRANVEINGERVNRIESYRYMNGESLPGNRQLPTVWAWVTDRGFEVADYGSGMSGATVVEKLLYPNASTKSKRSPEEDSFESDIRRETKIFFRGGKKKREKTKIRLQVSGVGIEEIETETSHDIGVCAIELPSWTWLPESRNQIQPTKEVVAAIKCALEKIHSQGSNLEEKLALAEIFSKVVGHLKGRQVGETNRAMKLENVARTGFEPIKKEFESLWITVLPADAELVDRIGERENARYVSPDFVKLDLATIPGILEITDIQDAKCPFFATKFSKDAEHDYLITPKGVLVNADKFGTPEERATLNAAINLAIGYEIENERRARFRWRITGDRVRKVSKRLEWILPSGNNALKDPRSNPNRNGKWNMEESDAEEAKWDQVLVTLRNILSEPFFQRILEEEEIEAYRTFRQEGFMGAKGRGFLEISENESVATYLQNWLRVIGLEIPDTDWFRLYAFEKCIKSRKTDEDVGAFSVGPISELVERLSPISERLFSVLSGHDLSVLELKRISGLVWEAAFQEGIPNDIRVRYVERFLDVLEADPKFAIATIRRLEKISEGWTPENRTSGFSLFPLISRIEGNEDAASSKKTERVDIPLSGPDVRFREEFEIEWQESLLNRKYRAFWASLVIWRRCFLEAEKKIGFERALEIKRRFDDPWQLEELNTEALLIAYEILDSKNGDDAKRNAYQRMLIETGWTPWANKWKTLEGERKMLDRLRRQFESIHQRVENFPSWTLDFPNESSLITDRPSIWNPEFSGMFWQYTLMSHITETFVSEVGQKCGDGIAEEVIASMQKHYEDAFVLGSKWNLYSRIYHHDALREELWRLPIERYDEFMRRLFRYVESFETLPPEEWALLESDLVEDFPEIAPFLLELLDFGDFHFKLFNENGDSICRKRLLTPPIYSKKSTYRRESETSSDPTLKLKGYDPIYREKFEVPNDWSSLLSPKNRYLRLMIGCSVTLSLDYETELVNAYLRTFFAEHADNGRPTVYDFIDLLSDLQDEYANRNEKPVSSLSDTETAFLSGSNVLSLDSTCFLLGHMAWQSRSLTGSERIVTDRPSLWNPELSGVFFANKFMNGFKERSGVLPKWNRPGKTWIYPALYADFFWKDFLSKLPYGTYLKFMKTLDEVCWADNVTEKLSEVPQLFNAILSRHPEIWEETLKAAVSHGSVRDFTEFAKAHFTFFNDEGNYVYREAIPLPIFEGETRYGSNGPMNTKPDTETHPNRIEAYREELKKFPQDLVAFVEFLYHGGEYLKESPGEIEISWEQAVSLRLSELTALSRFESKQLGEMAGTWDLLSLRDGYRAKNPDSMLYCDAIAASIEGQDHSTMIWTREVAQNGIDAIKRERKIHGREPLDSDRIDFVNFAQNGHYGVRISDNVGMGFSEVNNKLLLIGESGKIPGEGVGMFGQGFYSLAIGAEEIRLKTGTGDGRTTFVRMVPIHGEGWTIRDFEISQELRQETFKGTVIERIDESTGFVANLRAMMGNAYLQKYVGNVSEIPIAIEGRKVNFSERLRDAVEIEIPGIWSLRIIETPDGIERLTKDDLYVSEIPQEFLSDLPDWMEKIIRIRSLTIDLPSSVPLTKSRNAVANFEAQMKALRPTVLKALCEYVLKCYVERDVKIPMLPEDYYAIISYEGGRDPAITDFADAINAAGAAGTADLGNGFRKLLKDDQRNMAEFLTRVEFSLGGKRTTLQKIKSDLLSAQRVDGDFGNANFMEKLRDNLEFALDSQKTGDRLLGKDEMPTLLETTEEAFEAFERTLLQTFSPLVPGGISLRYVDSAKSVEGWAAPGDWTVTLNLPYVREIFSDYRSPETWEKIITTLTHEETHLLEDRGFWTHQLLTDHPKSFERIQRELLTKLLRN